VSVDAANPELRYAGEPHSIRGRTRPSAVLKDAISTMTMLALDRTHDGSEMEVYSRPDLALSFNCTRGSMDNKWDGSGN
jgi:hypothetical protein